MSTAESSPATVREMFVGGAWRPSASGETFEATSPVTGDVIGSIPQGDRSDAQAAVGLTPDLFAAYAEVYAGLSTSEAARHAPEEADPEAPLADVLGELDR